MSRPGSLELAWSVVSPRDRSYNNPEVENILFKSVFWDIEGGL